MEYERLVEPYRKEILAHCYRMLGSGEDAEDALQESMLRAWRGLADFAGRSSIRTWLYKIATNTCLDKLAKRTRRFIAVEYGPPAIPEDPLMAPLPETVWIEPYPDRLLFAQDINTSPDARYEQRESVELAFIAAYQLLSPQQRAVLILREVLGFSTQEIAETLEKSVASVNSLLQRARATLEQRRPELSQQSIMRSLGEDKLQTIVNDYIDAMERADIKAILAMLTEDATWSMPPIPNWYHGQEAISRFLTLRPFTLRWRHIPTRANGQLAVGCYMWNTQEKTYIPFCLDVLSLRGSQITSVTGFLNGALLERFGLPERL
ncbi:sigma-70 family RNA polymerase sigma factor [Cohnella endophytica]|uniref:Sigma-70 family RNA polymerase sigma factor n=1 Tax=Cohnella endophytica TaxID=2419778 RepID=A0A494XMD9_9BACL|nr:sigma-70 family RNA polymerase sigma factor [Cohnella endophytica]RKP49846.1 sigma-70 family RNA polymerase sigma factor [Cohnella endophytica]